jgi:hypothetical protein
MTGPDGTVLVGAGVGRGAAAAPWEAACAATPGPATMKAVTTATSQCLPDIPGLPDRASVEEWLSLPLKARRIRVSAGHSKYVIFIGSAL